VAAGDDYSQLTIASAPAARGALLSCSFDGKVNVFTISTGGAIDPLTTFTADYDVNALAATSDGGFVAAESWYDERDSTRPTRFHRFDRDGRFLERVDVSVERPALLATAGTIVMFGWSPSSELVSRRYGETSASPVSSIEPPAARERVSVAYHVGAARWLRRSVRHDDRNQRQSGRRDRRRFGSG
jgi:hypothetical protein